MVYLNKWATTIPEKGKKIIFIIPVGHHSYICILNTCKNEPLEKKSGLNRFETMTSPKSHTLGNILIVWYRLKRFLITAIEPEKIISTLVIVYVAEVASGSFCHISS